MSVVAEVPRSAVETQRAFAALAPLFRYPDSSWAAHLRTARTAMNDGATDFSPSGRRAAAAETLETFAKEIGALDLREHQSLYTSTFDLAPSCSPYLGAHRFGDESPERARLMVGLRMRYGAIEATELPDHVAEVLAFAAEFYEEEWNDLRELVIGPGIEVMTAILRATTNPYRHLLEATTALCQGKS